MTLLLDLADPRVLPRVPRTHVDQLVPVQPSQRETLVAVAVEESSRSERKVKERRASLEELWAGTGVDKV